MTSYFPSTCPHLSIDMSLCSCKTALCLCKPRHHEEKHGYVLNITSTCNYWLARRLARPRGWEPRICLESANACNDTRRDISNHKRGGRPVRSRSRHYPPMDQKRRTRSAPGQFSPMVNSAEHTRGLPRQRGCAVKPPIYGPPVEMRTRDFCPRSVGPLKMSTRCRVRADRHHRLAEAPIVLVGASIGRYRFGH